MLMDVHPELWRSPARADRLTRLIAAIGGNSLTTSELLELFTESGSGPR
jgi:hypothetical protein